MRWRECGLRDREAEKTIHDRLTGLGYAIPHLGSLPEVTFP
ncbi:MAG TPA: hypothetical protein VJK29_01465 [Terriglobales bacterium]|nr:hypothetical protein [Terriglobales bacterium]